MRAWQAFGACVALGVWSGWLALGGAAQAQMAPSREFPEKKKTPNLPTVPTNQLDQSTTAPMDGKPITLAPVKKTSVAFPLDRTFVAVSFKDQAFKDDRPSFQVSSSFRASGFSSCNNWSATIVARRDQRIGVGPMAVTKRQCDARAMHNEQVYLFVLQAAQTWYYDGRNLTLTSPYGTLTLEPAV